MKFNIIQFFEATQRNNMHTGCPRSFAPFHKVTILYKKRQYFLDMKSTVCPIILFSNLLLQNGLRLVAHTVYKYNPEFLPPTGQI